MDILASHKWRDCIYYNKMYFVGMKSWRGQLVWSLASAVGGRVMTTITTLRQFHGLTFIFIFLLRRWSLWQGNTPSKWYRLNYITRRELHFAVYWIPTLYAYPNNLCIYTCIRVRFRLSRCFQPRPFTLSEKLLESRVAV